ncbi:MAG: hexitol phosphatase HxpB [Candidatus Moranbacteria bacterium]|nr:hexitol phosphatase HxpB [Candidatus Moranbacteria bacterium]
MKTEAVIFDMDGLLIDSEPLWMEAEITVFRALGVPLTEGLCRKTMGMRIDEVVEHWFSLYPWQGRSQEDVSREILETVTSLVLEKGEFLPGAYKALLFSRKRCDRVALASSSDMSLINAVFQKLDLGDFFDVVCSGADEVYGKPHPAVFLSVATKLDVLPSECLVFEDSLNGVIAAKAAKMRCVAVPSFEMISDERFSLADEKLSSLSELSDDAWQRIGA